MSFSINSGDGSSIPTGPRKSVDISVLSGNNRQQYLRKYERRTCCSRTAKRLKSAWHWIYVNCLTFANLHAAYLTTVAFVGAFIIWLIENSGTDTSENDKTNTTFLDSLFNCISAVTCTGLTTADVSVWTKGSIVVAFIVMELGGICQSTCLIVPFLRYRRAKALAKRRIEHIETKEAEEAGGNTDDENSSDKEASDDNSSDDEESELVGVGGFPSFSSSSNLRRTVSSVNYSRPSMTTSTTSTMSKKDGSDGGDVPETSPLVASSAKKIILLEDGDEDQSSSALHTPSTVMKMPTTKGASTTMLLSKQGAASSKEFTGVSPKSSLVIPTTAAEDAQLLEESKCDDEELPDGARVLPKSLSKFREFGERTKRESSQLTISTTNIVQASSSSTKIPSQKSQGYRSSMMFGSAPGVAQQKVLPQNFLGLRYDYSMEQKALLQLTIVQLIYAVLIQLIVMIGVVIFATYNDAFADEMLQHDDNKWWFGLFMGGSSTTNLGFCYWEEGLTRIKDVPGLTLVLIFGVMAGNTCVPIFMRFFVWFCRNITPQRYLPKHSQPLRYVLKNPWRCSLHLFTSVETRILLLVYILLWTCVAAGYIGIRDTWDNLHEWIVAYFVSVSSRTSGFTIVDFSLLPASFVLLVIGSMFIAAYPVAMLRKQTKAVRRNEDRKFSVLRKRMHTLRKYWSQVFLSQMTWLFVLTFVVLFLEIRPDKPEMTLLSIAFEVVSAYGTVGYSFGLAGETLALAGHMHPVSKICIMIIMMMGRNRGLPTHVYPKDMREGVEQEVVMTNLEQ